MSASSNAPIITVIIPVYKTEKYLSECLDSVLMQKLGRGYEKRRVEIICVNDDSPDNSQLILEEYIKKYNNIVVIQQKNQGQSVARNNALKIATGEYVFFLDSDDLLPERAFANLLEVAKETNSEVIVSHAKAFNLRRSWYIEPHAEVASASLRKVKFFHKSILINSPPPWGKLYSRHLLVRNNIKFPEGIKLAEDWIFVIHAMYKANHISTTPEISYLYRGRDDEDNPSCTQIVNEKVFSDLVRVYGLTKNFNLPKQHQKHAKLFILRGILYRLSKFSTDNEFEKCKPTLQLLSRFLKENIELSMLEIFTPPRRLPLLLLYYGFYSEAHRVMNGIYNKSCLKRAVESKNNLITEDYYSLSNKKKAKNNIRLSLKKSIKKYHNLKWSFKYKTAKIVSLLAYRKRKIALIGERLGNTANDSSYFLFKHISKLNKTNKDYYFVIKKEAKTASNLNGLKNVITYGSFRHYVIFHRADDYIFSDSMRDVFHRWKDVAKEHEKKENSFYNMVFLRSIVRQDTMMQTQCFVVMKCLKSFLQVQSMKGI